MIHRRAVARFPVAYAARAALVMLMLGGVIAGCVRTVSSETSLDVMTPPEVFWASLRTLCGQAFAGTLVERNASDSTIARSELRMHVRECSDSVVRVPFHVGEDRSRTWVISRLADGRLRLKHDHRHADGSEDAVTQYGGDTRGEGTPTRQEFHADEHTAALIPAARTNVWTIEIIPGSRYGYALRREGTDRRFRVDFDLRQPVAAPPAPWGTRP